MVNSSLQDDLLGIPGVEGAEVDGSPQAPAGLRIRIAEGADQQAVGGAIRRVLNAHGLGTDTRLPGEAERPPPRTPDTATETEPTSNGVALLAADRDGPDEESAKSADDTTEQEVRTIIDLTGGQDDVAEGESSDMGEPRTEEPQLDEEEPSPQISETWDSPATPEPAPFVQPRVPVAAAVPETKVSVARVEFVSVEEGRSGIHVTVVVSDGTKATQIASSTEGGVETAVVKAAATLANPSAPDPVIVDISDRRVEGVDIVMIVLDVDGELMAGSAIVGAGRAFALGRATWAALSL